MLSFHSGLEPMQVALWLLGAFLAGSIPFGLILVKLAGKGDVRAQGSGNIGATNVSRIAGKGVGVLVLLLDAVKGFTPVFFVSRQELPVELIAAVALAAVVGHVFTPWLGFKGGKGVATTLGVALAYRAPAVLPSIAAFFLLLGIFRYVSLGSVIGSLILPIAMAWPHQTGPTGELPGLKMDMALTRQDPWQAMVCWSLIALLVIAKHRENIRRLLDGTESKLWGGLPSGDADA